MIWTPPHGSDARHPGILTLPAWQHGPILQAPIYAIQDSTGNGTGDLDGYRRHFPVWRDMGFRLVYAGSVGEDDGTDRGFALKNCRNIHPAIGTLDGFKRMVDEAHAHGLGIIIDYVLCHTSDQHPDFIESERNPRGRCGDKYLWHPKGDIYVSYVVDGMRREVRNMLIDDPDARRVWDGHDWVAARNWTWSDVRREWYFHPFKPSQPARNFANAEVRAEVLDDLRFWAMLGVAGIRLDAIWWAIPEDGTSCEDTAATRALVREIAAAMRREFPDLLLLGEADVPDDTHYVGPDKLHMAIDFRAREQLWLGQVTGDAGPLVDQLATRAPLPHGNTRLLAISTHDDVRAMYATEDEQALLRRELGNGRRGVQFVHDAVVGGFSALLDFDRHAMERMIVEDMLLPGQTSRYYRDLLGLPHHPELALNPPADGDERDALRTPMQWNDGPNAGFSTAAAQNLYLPLLDDPESGFQRLNVAAQQRDPHSWWNFIRNVNHLMCNSPALLAGRFVPLDADHGSTWGCVRAAEDEVVLGIVSRAPRPKRFRGGLPNVLAGRYDGATLIDVFGGEPIGQLRGDVIDVPLGRQGYLVAKLDRRR